MAKQTKTNWMNLAKNKMNIKKPLGSEVRHEASQKLRTIKRDARLNRVILSKKSKNSNSSMSFVGSCSLSKNKWNEFSIHSLSSRAPDDISCHSSDAQSFCGPKFTKSELAAEIRRFELHAYRSTIKALHASGPLSWEKETLLTNLRLSLNISSDEHLIQKILDMWQQEAKILDMWQHRSRKRR